MMTKIELRHTGFVTHKYEIRCDGRYDTSAEVVLLDGKLFQVKIGAITLTPHDIRILMEILKEYPLPPLPSPEGVDE